MARAGKLKVYRTAVGFHDAYVAAPSKKAALEAWGTKKDLFSRGAAELVTDEKLSAEPLAKPGEIIKRSRGTTAEQIAALPPNRPIRAEAVGQEKSLEKATPKPARKSRPKPKPSRAKVEATERAITDAAARYRRSLNALKEREAALAGERRKLDEHHEREAVRLEAAADRARVAFDEALARWEG